MHLQCNADSRSGKRKGNKTKGEKKEKRRERKKKNTKGKKIKDKEEFFFSHLSMATTSFERK